MFSSGALAAGFARSKLDGTSSLEPAYIVLNDGRMNSFVGINAGIRMAGSKASVGVRNVFVGANVGASATRVSNTVLVGGATGELAKVVEGGVWIGSGAGRMAGTSTGDTLVGHRAGELLQKSSFNTLVGYRTGGEFLSGQKNTAIGAYSGYYNQNCQESTYVGYLSGANQRRNSKVTAVGAQSGNAAVGSDGTLVGWSAGAGLHGDSATAVGVESGTYSTGDRNVMVGSLAASHLQGNSFTAVGASAAFDTKGDWCTVVGSDAAVGASGNRNTVLGADASRASRGNLNVIIGMSAGTGSPSLYGISESYIGDSSVLIGNIRGCSGDNNTLISKVESYHGNNSLIIDGGYHAKVDNACVMGHDAGRNLGRTRDSDDSVIIGRQAAFLPPAELPNQKWGGNNMVAIGSLCAQQYYGDYCTLVGSSCGKYMLGNLCTLVGYKSGSKLVGNAITAIGAGTAADVIGHRMTLLGAGSAGLIQGADSVIIGAKHWSRDAERESRVSVSNVVIIGSDVQHTLGRFSWYSGAPAFAPLALSNVVVIGSGVDVSNEDSESLVVSLNSARQDERAVQFRNDALYPDYESSLGIWSSAYQPSTNWNYPSHASVVASPGTYKFWFSGLATVPSPAAAFVGTVDPGLESDPQWNGVPIPRSTHRFAIFFPPPMMGIRYSALSLETFVITEQEAMDLHFYTGFQGGASSTWPNFMMSQLRLVPMKRGKDASFGAVVNPDTLELESSMATFFDVPTSYNFGTALATKGPLYIQPGFFPSKTGSVPEGNTEILLCGGSGEAPRVRISAAKTTIAHDLSVAGNVRSLHLSNNANRLVKVDAAGVLRLSTKSEIDVGTGGGGGGGGGGACNCWDAEALDHAENVSDALAGLMRVGVKTASGKHATLLVSYAYDSDAGEYRASVVSRQTSDEGFLPSVSGTSDNLVVSTSESSSASFAQIGHRKPVYDTPSATHSIPMTSADLSGFVLVTAKAEEEGGGCGLAWGTYALGESGVEVLAIGAQWGGVLVTMSGSSSEIVVATSPAARITWTFV